MLIVWIAKILASLNANSRSAEIGAAIAYAFLMALIPGGNLLWLGLLLLSFFLRINNAVMFVFLGLFSLVAGLFDPVTDGIGYAVLKWDALQAWFTTMANTPFVPWTQFNNTLVIGGLLFGILCFVPLTLAGSALVKAWRFDLRERLYNLKFVQAFLKWPVVSVVANILGKIFSVAKELV